MHSIIAVVAAIYGSSTVIVAGSGLAWIFSRRFRHSLIGDIAKN